jgi:hypothetical protein
VLMALTFLTAVALVAIVAVVIVLHRNGDSAALTAGGTTSTTAPPTTAVAATTTPAQATTLGSAAISSVPVSSSLATYESTAFSIHYPIGWVVIHIPLSGGNLDSTFQPTSSWNGWLIRVDEDPDSGGTLDAASDPVIAALEHNPTYGLVSLRHVSFNGIPALRWEFEDTENGVRLHKIDIFFIDAHGNGWGVLVQAPQSVWAQERAPLEDYQSSFSDLATS